MLNAQITHSTPNKITGKRPALDQEQDSPRKKRKIMEQGDKTTPSKGVPPVNGVAETPKKPAWKLPNGVPNPKPTAGTSKANAMQESRKKLPIWPGKDPIVKAIQDNDSVVLIGEPGSGKTTQVPQYIVDAGLLSSTGTIAVTQPRKVAAMTIATRVASERGVKVGSSVGYSVRFDSQHTPSTKITFYTDGMLLREMLNDAKLGRMEVVIVDEAHERTLRTDMLLANLKRVQKERKKLGAWGSGSVGAGAKGRNLKIVVMSASLQADKFSKYLDDAPVLYVQGRQHPVRLYFTKEPQPDYVDSALRTFFQIHQGKESGDVLIFLPGQEDIESLASAIKTYAAQLPVASNSDTRPSSPTKESRPASPIKTESSNQEATSSENSSRGVLVRPLYAALPVVKQHEAFERAPAGMRKVVLATNIAETSVTIPGIKFVIDTGVHNEKIFAGSTRGSGIERLTVSPISQSSAIQRAGRAGRDAPGQCFRLYTEATYKQLESAPTPEIKKCDLTFAMLQQKCLGGDLEAIEWMDKPELTSVKASRHILMLLGAFDSNGAVTNLGRQMARLPLEPRLSRAVVESVNENCTREVIDIVSLLSSASKVFFDMSKEEEREKATEQRKKFWHRSGDHGTLLNVFRAWDDISGKPTSATNTRPGTPMSTSTDAKEGSGTLNRSDRREWCRRQYINERALEEATRIRTQLMLACNSVNIDPAKSAGDDFEPVLKALFKGSVHNMALKQQDGSYKAGPTTIRIHPSSVLCEKKPNSIMFEELVVTSFPYARTVSSFPASWQMAFSDSLRRLNEQTGDK